VSYDCRDAEGGKVLLNQAGKFKCSAAYKYYGMQSEVPHCKKYGAVLPPSPRSTEQDMPLQEDWWFSIFLTQRISSWLVQKTRVNTGDNVLIAFMIVWTSLLSHT
jgi:hypothetical protein